MAAAIPVVRGDIVLVDLSGALGDEKNNDASLGARPCVIIQNYAGNKYRSVTIVAPITDGATYKNYPQQVFVTAKEISGPKDSVIECAQLRTIDQNKRIKKLLGKVAPDVIPRINAALKASLDLQ